MKYLLISLLFFIYGCSKDAPTASTEPKLDTTTRESSGSWTIRRWDGEDWIDTGDKLTLSTSWRFISSLNVRTDNPIITALGIKFLDEHWIKGGYTFTISNPSNYDVEFTFSRVVFEDRHGIPIYSHEFSTITRYVSANGTNTFVDTFEITLDDIDTAKEITKMSIWATAQVVL